jgi:GT2 family glycosyltransferase
MNSNMNSPASIGVVTVTYNSGRALEPFLSSLASQTNGNI